MGPCSAADGTAPRLGTHTQIPCVYEELQREADASREGAKEAQPRPQRGQPQPPRQPLAAAAQATAAAQPPRPKLRTAAERRAKKFVAYVDKLDARLQSVSRGPLAASPLLEVALVLGTTAVAPREVFRLKFANARDCTQPAADPTAGARSHPRDDRAPEGGGAANAAADERRVDVAIRRLLRHLYAAEPSKLHQSIALPPQRVHILARVARPPAEAAVGLAGKGLQNDTSWTYSPALNLERTCTRARVTTITFGEADAVETGAGAGDAAEGAGPTDAVTDEAAAQQEAAAGQQHAAAEQNNNTASLDSAIAALTLLHLDAGPAEFWYSLAALERSVKPPSQRGRGGSDGTHYV